MKEKTLTIEKRKSAVIVSSIQRLETILHISDDDLRQILRLDASAWQKIKDGDATVDTKTQGAAALLLNLYDRLSNLLGNDSEAMSHWLKSLNKDFKKTPLEQIKTEDGLNDVVEYLQAFSVKGA